MKRFGLSLLALLMAATMLLSACTSPDTPPSNSDTPNQNIDTGDNTPLPENDKIHIPNLEKTATESVSFSFSATFSQNDYDSYPDRVNSAHFTDGENTFTSSEGYVDLMPHIKSLTDDLSKIGTLEVSIVATDVSRWTNTINNNEINPTYQFHKNDRSDDAIKTSRATKAEGEATLISFGVPSDAEGLILLPYGFNPEAGAVKFEVTIHAILTAKYERAYKDSVIVLAGSDFQDTAGSEVTNCVARMERILGNVDKDIKFDGFLFCGDYDCHSVESVTETELGVNALDEFISNYVVDDDKVFVKGNHDSIVDKISPSGANDTDEYGVFVINESDYMWHNDDEATVKEAAQNLVEYLNEKLDEKYSKPIFVTSHLALHYTMRTRQDGDGRYAHYFFDPLNEAAKKGLNIIFLYGHDHSNSWDDYLGGGAVFLTKGDSINISQGEKDKFEVEKLNFTYMNAGFVGYYDRNNEGACDMLSMTVFEIIEDEIVISRISESGIELLKAKGVRNAYKSESGYDPDEREVKSYQQIEMTEVTKKSRIKDIISEEKIDTNGKPYYKRITKDSDLKDGGKYLIVVQQRGTDDYYVMTPEVITKEGGSGTRVGFKLMVSSGFDQQAVIIDRLQSREWIFKKSGDKWLIGDGEKFIHMEQTSDKAITATLEATGDPLTIAKDGSKFSVGNGEFWLNHNTSRGLINGYASEPAYIYIFEYVD